ncbi:hypothetical protein WN943_011003 [Citrus x changshan-huyou]
MSSLVRRLLRFFWLVAWLVEKFFRKIPLKSYRRGFAKVLATRYLEGVGLTLVTHICTKWLGFKRQAIKYGSVTGIDVSEVIKDPVAVVLAYDIDKKDELFIIYNKGTFEFF